MNVDASSKNCAEAPPQRIEAGDCNATVSDCFATASSKCDSLADCRSFTIHVNDQQCSSTAGRWALFTLGNESFSRRNDDWVAYAKPPAPPPTPTPPPPPTPPGACASPVDCSLNGLCTAGACVCDAPWHGDACELLQRLPAAPGGIYGWSPNVTSWGGNVIQHNGTWHLYATEMAGKGCGLHVWGNQSTVVHATAASVEGPYERRSEAVGMEGHNPQAIVVNGSWYIFHIGTGTTARPPHDCSELLGLEGAKEGSAAPAAFPPFSSPSPAPSWPAPPLASSAGGGTIHKSASPEGPFSPIAAAGYSGCNNPSPFLHPNGTLLLACTWSLRSAPRPEGPWGSPTAIPVPNTRSRTWEGDEVLPRGCACAGCVETSLCAQDD
jgi:hypothetical protein